MHVQSPTTIPRGRHLEEVGTRERFGPRDTEIQVLAANSNDPATDHLETYDEDSAIQAARDASAGDLPAHAVYQPVAGPFHVYPALELTPLQRTVQGRELGDPLHFDAKSAERIRLEPLAGYGVTTLVDGDATVRAAKAVEPDGDSGAGAAYDVARGVIALAFGV